MLEICSFMKCIEIYWLNVFFPLYELLSVIKTNLFHRYIKTFQLITNLVKKLRSKY